MGRNAKDSPSANQGSLYGESVDAVRYDTRTGIRRHFVVIPLSPPPSVRIVNVAGLHAPQVSTRTGVVLSVPTSVPILAISPKYAGLNAIIGTPDASPTGISWR